MPAAVPRFLSAASSDQGSVRPNNEDRVYSDDARGIYLVVDGMGGHEAGEHAAEIAVERIRARLERQTGTVEQRLREAITLANNAIYDAAQQTAEWRGMACVLTAAVIDDGQVTAGHVGDSRLYRIRNGMIDKLTHDHSPVGEREDAGELNESEAMRHPRRNEVFRDVGSEEHSPDDHSFIEILRSPFEPDAAFLLCSDGLSDAISSAEILRIVKENAGDRWATVRALIAAANESGKDNVSAILIEGENFAQRRRKRRRKKARVRNEEESSPGEITDRLTPPPTRVPWYRSSLALVGYGALLGGAAMFAYETFAIGPQKRPSTAALRVESPGTIAAALAKARPGDTVVVAPGTYAETVRLRQGIALVAERVGAATIRGSLEADGLKYSRVEGFKIRAPDGVRINNSDVVLIRDDIAESRGAGVSFTGDSRGGVFACTVHNNSGPGIVISDTAAPAIENNYIDGEGHP